MAEVVEGVTPVEAFVLEESDGACQLWELAAAWTDHGSEDERRAAVPLLREAVVNLSRRAFVDVHELVQLPGGHDTAEAISSQRVAATISDVRRWLRSEEATSLVTVTLTDAGVPYL
ncbi:hypothetical protein ABZ799_26740 [Nocardiopsis dassonvillei]|uniref:hypothetical protein n=1 Tax=Nocardiopsis dassonvillei TaxID=2014 RepID=UPI0033CD2FFC